MELIRTASCSDTARLIPNRILVEQHRMTEGHEHRRVVYKNYEDLVSKEKPRDNKGIMSGKDGGQSDLSPPEGQ